MKRLVLVTTSLALSLGIACAVHSADDSDQTSAAESNVFTAPLTLTHGPLLGDVRPGQVTVWMRLSAPGGVKVRWRRGSGAFGTPVAASTGSDDTVFVTLTGLQAASEYGYELSTDGGVTWSSEYRFQTAPGDGATPSFSFVVLTDFEPAHAPALVTALSSQPAFAVLMGDLDHEGPGNPRYDDPLSTMRAMRQNLRTGVANDAGTAFGGDFYGSPDAGGFIQNATRQIPLYYSWDDHDYCDNNADHSCAARDQAIQVLQEYFVPSRGADFGQGSYQYIQWGSEAAIYLLDARSSRNEPDGGVPNTTTMLGARQLAWLEARMLAAKNKGIRYHFLLSPVPFNPNTKTWDAWGLYPAERDQIVAYSDAIGLPRSNVVVISGDIHTGGAVDDGTHSSFTELSCPQANMGSFVDTFIKNGDAGAAAWTHGATENGWPNTGLHAAGFVRVDVDGTNGVATVSVRDGKTGAVRTSGCGHTLSYTMRRTP